MASDDREGQRALAEYIPGNAFSARKITYLEDTRKVLYRSAMTHGSNKKNFEIHTAEEFIAAITQPIPDKSIQMVRWALALETVPTSRRRSSFPASPPPSYKEATLANDLPHSCPNPPQPCQKIKTKTCLTNLAMLATQKPSESDFLISEGFLPGFAEWLASQSRKTVRIT